MEYYSANKKNAFESVLMRWIKLEPIIQSEVSQKEKNKLHPRAKFQNKTYHANSQGKQEYSPEQ